MLMYWTTVNAERLNTLKTSNPDSKAVNQRVGTVKLLFIIA